MNRIFILTALLCSFTYGIQIPLAKVKIRSFGRTLLLNSKIVQLPNAKQSIMSLVSGHIEKYFVEAGSKVKRGQKIALIESIALSRMTAEYLALKEQYKASNANYEAAKKLYEKGMISLQKLNLQTIQKNDISSNINRLTSQLQTLGIDVQKLKKASADYILYAHASGTIASLLQPLHSVIGEDTPIVSIVQEHAFYLESYLPLEYAHGVKPGQKITAEYNGRILSAQVIQILPELNEITQRAVIIASLNNGTQKLFINAYLPSTLYFEKNKSYTAVKRSALSFFENEWVVFVPKKSAHEEHEVSYEARAVKVITQDEEFAAVEGIEEGEEYASDGSYYIKSMLLKSSFGGHAH